MENGPKNPFKLIQEDILKTVVVTMAVAFTTGLSGAVIDGAWQKALLAACGLTMVLLAIILVATAVWHSKELEEVKFEEMRAKDAERRELAKLEREQREHIARAARKHCDPAGQKADLSAMLERWRKHISTGRISTVEILLISDAKPHAPVPVAQAGRFDQAVLSDPQRLVDWIEGLGERACGFPVPIPGMAWRVLGIADTTIDGHDKFELQRVATHVMALKLAHQVACDSLEESA